VGATDASTCTPCGNGAYTGSTGATRCAVCSENM
jgi:hypothetical protein